MKKYVFTLLLSFLSWQASLAQSSTALFEELRQEAHAEYVYASPFLMFIGKMFCNYEDEGKEIVSKIRSAKVLELDKCTPEVRQRFVRRFEALSGNGYETLVRMNEDGERMHILARRKKDVICELLVASVEDNECSLIQINGKIRKQDIARLINKKKTNRKKHGRR